MPDYKPREITTVGELISQLKKFNKNARVVGYDSEYAYYHAITPMITDAEDRTQLGPDEYKIKGKVILIY